MRDGRPGAWRGRGRRRGVTGGVAAAAAGGVAVVVGRGGGTADSLSSVGFAVAVGSARGQRPCRCCRTTPRHTIPEDDAAAPAPTPTNSPVLRLPRVTPSSRSTAADEAGAWRRGRTDVEVRRAGRCEAPRRLRGPGRSAGAGARVGPGGAAGAAGGAHARSCRPASAARGCAAGRPMSCAVMVRSMMTEFSGSCAAGAGGACAPFVTCATDRRRGAHVGWMPPPWSACSRRATASRRPVKGASSSSHEGRNIDARRSASSGVSRASANAAGALGPGSAG